MSKPSYSDRGVGLLAYRPRLAAIEGFQDLDLDCTTARSALPPECGERIRLSEVPGHR